MMEQDRLMALEEPPAQHRDEVAVLLDRKCLETALPNPAVRVAAPVKAPHMGRQQPVHPARQVPVVPGANHQVEVVGHQASAEEIDRKTRLGLNDQTEEREVVPRATEDGGPVIGPIDDVVAPATSK